MPLTLNGTTGEIFPSWTTLGRPSPATAGQTGYNSTLNTLERYNGTSWGPIVTTSDTGTVTSTMLASDAITRSLLPAGSVLQVVSTTKTDTFSSTATTFTDITGLSLSITPTKSTSKILLLASVVGGSSVANVLVAMRLVRGSTAICIGDAAANYTQATVGGLRSATDANASWNFSMNFLDSPSTTSSTTYKIQGYAESASTWRVNTTGSDTSGSTWSYRGASTITAIEVSA